MTYLVSWISKTYSAYDFCILCIQTRKHKPLNASSVLCCIREGQGDKVAGKNILFVQYFIVQFEHTS